MEATKIRLYGGPMASVKQFQVTFDCAEPERVARFWCEALGYVVRRHRRGSLPGTSTIARCRRATGFSVRLH